MLLECYNQAMDKAKLESYIVDSLNTKVNLNYTGVLVY